MYVFFLRIRRPPRSTRTDTLFPYTTLFRSDIICAGATVVAARSGAGMAQDRDRRNLPPLNLHVPKPKFRPGDAVDFTALEVESAGVTGGPNETSRPEANMSELQSLMRISYAVSSWKKKRPTTIGYSTECFYNYELPNNY